MAAHYNQHSGAQASQSQTKPTERPLKNKFVHRATGVIPSANTTQKIPIVEKPRNFFQASEEAEVVLADTEMTKAEQPHL